MAKIVYFWDSNNEFDHSEFYQNDSDLPNPLPNNATLVVPANGLYEPIKWDGTTWQGTPKEEWLAAHPTPAPEPTDQDKANAALTLQIAQNKATQDKLNAQLMLALASNSQNGGVA